MDSQRPEIGVRMSDGMTRYFTDVVYFQGDSVSTIVVLPDNAQVVRTVPEWLWHIKPDRPELLVLEKCVPAGLLLKIYVRVTDGR